VKLRNAQFTPKLMFKGCLVKHSLNLFPAIKLLPDVCGLKKSV